MIRVVILFYFATALIFSEESFLTLPEAVIIEMPKLENSGNGKFDIENSSNVPIRKLQVSTDCNCIQIQPLSEELDPFEIAEFTYSISGAEITSGPKKIHVSFMDLNGKNHSEDLIIHVISNSILLVKDRILRMNSEVSIKVPIESKYEILSGRMLEAEKSGFELKGKDGSFIIFDKDAKVDDNKGQSMRSIPIRLEFKVKRGDGFSLKEEVVIIQR